MPIDADMEFTGNLFTLLNPVGLLGGLVTLSLFVTHGATYIALKTVGDIRLRARALAWKSGAVAAGLAVVFLIVLQVQTGNIGSAVAFVAAAVLLLAGVAAAYVGREGVSFAGTFGADRLRGRGHVPRPLPRRDAVVDRRGLQPHHHQRGRDVLHADDHDVGGGDLHADRAGLPDLDLLGLPQAHRHPPHPDGGARLAMKPLDPALRPHLAPARGPLVAATLAGVVGGVLLIAQAFAVASLIVRTARGESITAAAIATAAVFVARGVLGLVVDLATTRAAGAVSTALRGKVLRASLGDRRRTGELAVLLTRGLGATEPWFTRYLPALVVAGVVPLLTVGAIAWLDPWSGLIVALTVPLVPVFAALVGMTTRDRAQRQWRLLQSLSGHFLDVVRGLPTLVAHRRAAAQVDTIRAVTHRHRVASMDTLKLAFASSVVLELLATLSVALVAVCVGLRLAHGSLDFHTALVVLLLAPEAYWPMRRVGAEFHAAAEGAAAFSAVDLALEHSPVRRVAGTDDDSGVVLDGVTLDWGGAPVVADLTTRFGIGLTAIVGPSGCGKSTLLAALAGELAPTSGTLRIAGHGDPADWRSAVAWVPQRPWLSADTIADNLRHADPAATDARLWRALERVDLAHVVLTLPAGLETLLGEDGGGLSAGERARLSLARVLVSDRPVVLLDEPTAHLDASTEAVLARVDRRAGAVAHGDRRRAPTALVDLADRVLTLGTLPAPAATGRPVVTALGEPDDWTPSRRADLGAIALGALLGGLGRRA